MDFIIADSNGIEQDILKERQYIDMDIGGTNDFEIHISNKIYKSLGVSEGWRIGVHGEEYGGIINKIKTETTDKTVVLSGPTWRGMITKKIIEPPVGEDYRTVNGDANTIINSVICAEFNGIFVCSGMSGLAIENYKFDRYVDDLAGIEKMLLTKNARLNIAYDSGNPNEAGFVRLSAVPIHDYSDELEYSKDGTLSFLSFSFERFTGGINHLICLGKGNLKDRLVIHLYVQEDGTIGNNKFYTGEDERTSVYDYSSCESAEELQEKGIERLKELMSYTNMDMDLYNQSLSGLKGMSEDVAIGDIVGGRDKDTGIYLSKQITQKIVAVKSGRESINYKVGGNTLNRSTATAPAEPTDAYQEQIDAINTSLATKFDKAGGTITGVTTHQNPIFFSGYGQSIQYPVTTGNIILCTNSKGDAFNIVDVTTGSSSWHVTYLSINPSANTLYLGSGANTISGATTFNHTVDMNSGVTIIKGATIDDGVNSTNGQYKHGSVIILHRPANQQLLLASSEEANYRVFLGVRSSMWGFSPYANGTVSLGFPNYRWGQVYSSAGSISTSDRNEKHDIESLDEFAKDFVLGLNPVSYKMNDGTSGRTHMGMIAQDIEDLLSDLNMTSKDFAGFIKSPKYGTIVDEDGNITEGDIIPDEYIYGLRYEEFISPLIKTVQIQQKEIDDLKDAIVKQQAEIEELKQMFKRTA